MLARDADAPRRGREDQRRLPGVSQGRGPRAVGRSARRSASSSAIRNAQATVLAPTGTISFMMDCDTTGIEPDIALVKYKQLAGGGMLKIVNNTVPLALKTLGYDEPTDRRRSSSYIDEHDTIEGAPELARRAPAGLRLCLQAGQRRPQHRLAGPRADDGGRPAVPLRGDQQDGQHAARRRRRRTSPTPTSEGWQLGLKALAIYRDGSKQSQPLNTKSAKATRQRREGRRLAKPRRERLPDTRQLDHAQVQRRRARGLHQRRPVSTTAGPASCSSRWPRKAAPSAA